MKTIKLIFTIASLFCFANASYSAPFCAVFSHGKQCNFYNYNQCMQAAGDRGTCVTNRDEVSVPSGGSPFCVITSVGTQCNYYDVTRCRQAASASGGVCVVKD